MTLTYYLKILTLKEKQEIEKKLNEQFGVEKILGIITMRGKERLFLFQGSLNENQIRELEQTVPIERVGVYFAKEVNGEIRLSVEGVQILKNQITKNIFDLDENQAEQWMMGSELNIKTETKGFLIMKHKDYFLGCGKASKEKIGNFIPKNRRLKYKEN